MKVVILAGGLGSRLSEETVIKPKPMVEIGGKPILWHIMKIYSHYGFNDFVVCLGYKGYYIKEYFYHYAMHMSDVTIDLRGGMEIHNTSAEPWRLSLIDTGENSMTGGRLKRIRRYVEGEEAFCMTYGDGVSDVDIGKLVAFHKAKKTLATVTAVHPSARFGALEIDDGIVRSFREKPKSEGGLINGGFFVLSPKVLDYIEGDATPFEIDPLNRLVNEGQLSAFEHEGFWQPMDTIRDRSQLEEHWASGRAPWKVWAE